MKSRSALEVMGWSFENLNSINPSLNKGCLILFSVILLLFCVLTGCSKRDVVGVTVGMEAAERFWIRVLLFDNIRECRLSGEAGFSVVDELTGAKGDFRKPYRPLVVSMDKGRVVIGEHTFGREVVVRMKEPFVFELDGVRYRGNLKFITADDGQSFKVINIVPVDSYLAGVVGAEMPSYWEIEALKAQATAARTYCLFIKNTVGDYRKWDVKKTQAHQVYKGISAESARVWEAVRETTGEILICRQGENGEERIFPSYYASNCGGHTENSENVFGDSYEPLFGVKCPYCQSVAKKGFYFWKSVEFKSGRVSNRILARYEQLKKLERIVKVEAHKVTDYGGFGRVVSVKLTGSNGKTGFLRGEDFRLCVDPTGKKLKSAIFNFSQMKGKLRFENGRGFGHGVGMCQCGAEAMARAGNKADEILGVYYPGSKTMRLY